MQSKGITYICIILCLVTFTFIGMFALRYNDFVEFQNMYEREEYQEILSWAIANSNAAYELHNLWNTSYKLYEQNWSIHSEELENAISYYSGALMISEHPDTRYNYELLLKEQEKFTQEWEGQEVKPQESEEENTDESSPESGSWSSSEESESSSSDQQQAWQPSISSRDDQYKLNKQESIDKLTQQEEQALEDTIERLKQEQFYNQRYFGKEETPSNFDNLFEMFFEGSIDRGWEKDW